MVNVGFYSNNEEQLLADLERFNPEVLMLGWCWSLDGDVEQMLRRSGLFSSLVLRHGLQMLTNNPEADLNKRQKELINEIGKYNTILY